MHSTDHKHQACQTAPWLLKNADRRCEHGDSALLRSVKRTAAKKRRQSDKREAQR